VPGESDPATTGLEDPLALGTKSSSAAATEPEAVKRMGPYRLLQLIGEGGMGEVWLAEQVEPIRRRVAIKVIKAGMDTKHVVARFESERQALAVMDHPVIAKVFDGGSTPEGRPYFVMEYVAGVPITEHCDTHRLVTTARLELFAQVCEGVQHAHQKAIIHRDLKPSNILVSLVDGKAQPRIIDFGIAKATGHRLTEKTLFTEVGAIIGTPEYMSPEQADLTGQDVDTRTDVYSLGVVLYQLLTGELPFGSKELRSSSYEELRRKLKEVEPPRPSTKLSTLSDGAAQAAKNRNTDPGGLRRQLEGDLDAITMKALEKDRGRRYGTPSELAADIGRHLRNEPVVARPPSRTYRVRRYVRRHRLAVGAVSTLLAVLLAFTSVMAIQARRVAHERDRASAERDRANREAAKSRRVTKFLTDMFDVSTPGEGRGNSITAQQVLDGASKEMDVVKSDVDPELKGELLYALGNAYRSLRMPSRAESLLARAVEVQRRVLGPEHPDTLRSMSDLALAMGKTGGRRTEVGQLARETLDLQRRVLGAEHPDTLQTMSLLAHILRGEGSVAESEKLHRETLDARRRVLGPEHPLTLWSMQSLALTLAAERHFAEAEQLDREALEAQRRVLGADHPGTIRGMFLLANVLTQEGKLPEAEKLTREEVETSRHRFGPEYPNTLESMDDLAQILIKEGRHKEAEQLEREVLEVWRQVSGPGSPEVALAQYNLAGVLARQGKAKDALSLLRDALNHGLDTDTALGMSKDPDLTSLHGDPRFEALVSQVKTRTSASR